MFKLHAVADDKNTDNLNDEQVSYLKTILMNFLLMMNS